MTTKEFFVKLFFITLYLFALYYMMKYLLFSLVDRVDKNVDNSTIVYEYVNNTKVGMCNYADVEVEEPKEINLGKFKLTAYCSCEKCCGKSDGITSTGTKATQGRTIAVDPKVIGYGSKVKINGKEYVAEDCGGAIKSNHIDVFFNNHQDALDFGVQYANVYIKK